MPQPSETFASLGSDPKGLTYEPAWTWGGDYYRQVKPLIPDVGFWNCSFPRLEQPSELKETALYLTISSVSTELDGGTHISHPEIAAATRTQSSELSSSLVPDAKATPTNHPDKSQMAAPSSSMSSSAALSHTKHVASPIAKTSDGREFSKEDSPGLQLMSPSPSAATNAPQPLPSPTEDIYTTGGSTLTAPVESAIGTIQSQSLVASLSINLPGMVLTPSIGKESISASAFSTSDSFDNEAAPIVLGSHTISTNDNSQYMLASQTLIPDSPITLGSGPSATSIILHTSSSQTLLIVGSSTSTLPANPVNSPALPALSIGSQAVSANSENQYIIESQTLALNSPITLGSGTAATPVLLQTTNSNTILIVGSSTSTLAAAATAAATPPPFTIGSQVITANSENQYIVASQTLTPGALITVSGTPVSLAPSATQVVVGSSTQGLGGQIMSGFIGANPSASGTGVMPFTGAAERRWEIRWWLAILVIGAISLMAWL